MTGSVILTCRSFCRKCMVSPDRDLSCQWSLKTGFTVLACRVTCETPFPDQFTATTRVSGLTTAGIASFCVSRLAGPTVLT